MTLADVALIGLAAWRLAVLLVVEAGPLDAIAGLRRIVRADASGLVPGPWQKLWLCVYCMTFWTALAAYALWRWDDDPGRTVVEALAVWGAATALDMLARKE